MSDYEAYKLINSYGGSSSSSSMDALAGAGIWMIIAAIAFTVLFFIAIVFLSILTN